MSRLRDLIRQQPNRGLSMPLWLDRLLSVGIVSADPQVVRRQRCVNVATYVAVLSGASYIALTSLYDLRGLLQLNIYNVLLVITGIALPFWRRLGENFAAIVLVLLAGAGQLYVVWMLGLSSELHVFYLLAGASLFFFGIQNWKLFAGVFICLALLLQFALSFAPVDGLLLPTDARLRDLILSQTLFSVLLINAVIIFYALTLVHSAETRLQQEHERSEALIATVMPDAIAARLKTGEERIADAAYASLGNHKLDLRVGLHCGAATAGVIGDMRFSYDIWGDAVNVAARMESHGLPGRIQVSEVFRDLTQKDFAFEDRGEIQIKSIGRMRTHFLSNLVAEAE